MRELATRKYMAWVVGTFLAACLADLIFLGGPPSRSVAAGAFLEADPVFRLRFRLSAFFWALLLAPPSRALARRLSADVRLLGALPLLAAAWIYLAAALVCGGSGTNLYAGGVMPLLPHAALAVAEGFLLCLLYLILLWLPLTLILAAAGSIWARKSRA